MKKKKNGIKNQKSLLLRMGAIVEKIGHRLGYFKSKRTQNLFFQLESNGYEISFEDDLIMLAKDNKKVSLRQNSSDREVAEQVLLKDEYGALIKYIIDNNIPLNNIIDAGSNIGLTSFKILTTFPSAKVLCLEPDSFNFKQLIYNLGPFSERVIFLEKALWHKEEILFFDFDFRDGKEWSRRVSSANRSDSKKEVEGITLDKIISEFGFQIIDLLKIDIEGAEADIFSNTDNFSFLNKVRLIAIEIHDEFNCRDRIYEVLKKNHFLLFNSGELTVGINQQFLGFKQP